MVQWLRLEASNAKSMGSILVRELRSHMAKYILKKKKIRLITVLMVHANGREKKKKNIKFRT